MSKAESNKRYYQANKERFKDNYKRNWQSWYQKNKEKRKEYNRAYFAKWFPKNRAKRKEYMKAFNQTPEQVEKIKVRSKTRNAVLNGKLERKPCEVCGALAEIHHLDYSQPFNIRFLCKEHHAQEHSGKH